MKTLFTNRLGTLLLAAALLLTPLAARAQISTTEIEIKSVDNYAGNSNVYTNKPNTTVTVTELDADKKPVRHWTGTTDSEGKLTIQAGHNLSQPYLRAVPADPKMAEFVLPSEIKANEPFTFAAQGTVEGEVISVQTVEGEVVATKKPDKYGRVFLPAGLAAGAYLLSASHGNSSRLGNIVIDPHQQTLPETNWAMPLLQNTDHGTIDVPNSGNAMDLKSTIGGHDVPVLAASTREIVCAAPADFGVKPGKTNFSVVDKPSGQTLESGQMVVYSANAKLTQVTVLSGTQTHLVVTIEPKSLGGSVAAHILSGPVGFQGGGNEATMPVQNGTADFALQSQSGSIGKFQVTWLFSPEPNGLQADNKGGDTKALDDDGWVKFKDDDGRTGKKKVVGQGEGFRREIKAYDDGSSTMTTERTGTKRKTIETDTTTIKDGVRTEVVEKMEYEPDGKGGWKIKSGTRETSTFHGDTKTTTSETWGPGGWH